MADIFTNKQAQLLLKNKFMLMIGDSNMRNTYKDIVHLICNNSIISPQLLLRPPSYRKHESFQGDRVIRVSEIDNAGRDYYEEREFKVNGVHMRFHFTTRVGGIQTKQTLIQICKKEIPMPDILIINSCIWDLTRWGAMRENEYKKELVDLFGRLQSIFPKESLIIWSSTLPTSVKCTKGGLIVKQLEFVRFSLRFTIMEANKFTSYLCALFGVNFLDLHYHLRFQLHRRAIDGLHWEPQAYRQISCTLLTHISITSNIPLPGLVRSKYLTRTIEKATASTPDLISQLNEGGVFNGAICDPDLGAQLKEELKRVPPIIKPKETGPSQSPEKTLPVNPKQQSDSTPKVKLKARRRRTKTAKSVCEAVPSQSGRFGDVSTSGSSSRPLFQLYNQFFPTFESSSQPNSQIEPHSRVPPRFLPQFQSQMPYQYQFQTPSQFQFQTPQYQSQIPQFQAHSHSQLPPQYQSHSRPDSQMPFQYQSQSYPRQSQPQELDLRNCNSVRSGSNQRSPLMGLDWVNYFNQINYLRSATNHSNFPPF